MIVVNRSSTISCQLSTKMGRNKLYKFEALRQLEFVYENKDPENPQLTNSTGEVVDLKGNWCSLHFQNSHPLVLELACGRGEYSLGLAQLYPNKNFIGLDIKGARLFQGSEKAVALNLKNVAFLRTRIEQIGLFFDKNEVDEIWITFPDPFLRESKSNRRLTSIPFLERFYPILKQDAFVNLKTDSFELYTFTLDTLNQQKLFKLHTSNENIYAANNIVEALLIQTYYERMHLAAKKTIKFVSFNKV